MAWYLKLPDGAFLGKYGPCTQQQAAQFGSQSAAQAMIPYYARMVGGVKATAVSLGSAPAQTADSPGYDPKLANDVAVNTAPILAITTTGYATNITGYGAA